MAQLQMIPSLTRLLAIVRYAIALWRNQSMPVTIESITESDLRVLTRQAELDGVPLDPWMRNTLLRACSPNAIEYGRPTAFAAVESTLAGMDAVDVMFADDVDPKDPTRATVDEDGILFGVPPTDPQPAPAPAPSPQTEAHPRTRAPAQVPIVQAETVVGHPCRHLTKGAPSNFAATACQGTCNATGRAGNPCNWGPNVAKGCPYFQGKMLPVPARAPVPRQG